MAGLKVKKGDEVVVIAGKYRGRRGRVLRVDRDRRRVVVEGINMIKRHQRAIPQRNVQGGIVEREAPFDISNVMVISPESGRPTRVGTKTLDDGRKVRIARTDGAILDR